MKRSRLRNIYLKNRSDNNKREYNKQRNYCVSLLRKTKTNFYANLNEKDLSDNKQFWRTVKPLLSARMLDRLTGCLTELCVSDFY